MSNIINKALAPVGLEIHRTTRQSTYVGMLERLKKRGTKITTVIDVGASDGRWSVQFASRQAGHRHHLIEARQAWEKDLQPLCAKRQWSYQIKACGSAPGRLWFNSTDPLGGHLHPTQLTPKYSPIEVTSIDSEVERLQLPGPYLIKLDTHGVEVPILEGALKTLQDTTILIIECYNFPTPLPCLSFWAMCSWMESRGYRPVDMFDELYRDDGALWQMDIVFERMDSPVFKRSTWLPPSR